ncbi:MAG TPA: adenylyl-sulfate kinase [Gemmataceae bacterium]|nr:adenylyl-sulfate kinase [Reyranella sp.]HZV05801.1 adenylyl-sulfate kinase [Gemmataceae bacterium]
MRAAAIGTQLRFITCGSVDDGKSTLMGRLLWECSAIFDDQLEALRRDSRRHGTTGEELDFALLLDGLEAEREQGITIDVAYRYFATPQRSFVAIDCPGHEQYTRNMATGASEADLAVILVDARKGLLTQTMRHAVICALLGVGNVVLAVNKMDLAAYDVSVFERIRDGFGRFVDGLGFSNIQAIPVSALVGDNIGKRSTRMDWYEGPTLLDALETAGIDDAEETGPFRLPVQLVLRPNLDFRGIAGNVVSGRIRIGEEIVGARTGGRSLVAKILGTAGEQSVAKTGEAVVLTLAGEIDVSRGELMAIPQARPTYADQFTAHLVWMSEETCHPGRQYLMRLATQWVPATVGQIKYRLNIENLEHVAARELKLNEIGAVDVAAAAPVAFDTYAECRSTGSFILVDRLSNATVAMGMVLHSLRRATNVHWETALVDKKSRATLLKQTPKCIWFTGLSGSGKSTIAKELELQLHRRGCHTMILDGDNLRHGLNRNLGFTETDRVENIRRAGEVARLMTEAGLIVICSFISPYRADRELVRSMFMEGEFLEVFVDTPLEECIRRDPKGLYAKALKGEIPNFTGISAPYEKPDKPELWLQFGSLESDSSVPAQVQRVLDMLFR